MRRTRTVACPSCGARWDAGRARFCGWCGLPLRRPDLPGDDEDGPRRRWSPRAAWAGGAAAVVAAVAAVALLVDGFELPRGRPDPTVELADDDGAEVVAQGEPLSADERAALLAPFDPDRLRCEPEGCETWRVDFGRSVVNREVAVFGDLVVSSGGETITAFHADTGEEAWQRSWPATDAQPSRGWTVMLPAGDDLLVMVRPESGHLLGLRRDGSVAWQDHEPRPMQNFHLAGSVLLTSQLERPGRRTAGDGEVTFPSERIVARNAASGAQLWERTNTSLMSSSAAVTVAREGTDGIALDPVDGSVRARRELATDVWLYALGQVVLVFTQDGTTEVLTTDLEPIPELAGLTELQPVSRNGQPMAGYGNGSIDFLVGIRRDDEGSARVLLADTAGTVLWAVEPPPTAGTPATCCPDPRLTGDALALSLGRGSDGPQEAWFDLADGTVVEPRDDVPPPPDVDNAWWLTPEVAVEQRGNGVRLHADGAVLDVLGEGAWPLTHGPPYVFTNGRSLLGVQPVPAG